MRGLWEWVGWTALGKFAWKTILEISLENLSWEALVEIYRGKLSRELSWEDPRKTLGGSSLEELSRKFS